MNTLTILVLLIGAFASCQGQVKILNGTDAQPGQFPYQVALLKAYNKQFCGGSILNKRWILTAAHCAHGSAPEDLKVAMGSVFLSKGTIYRLEKIVLHENWNNTMKIADIALLKTSEDIRLDANVQPIPLATSDQVLSKAVVSGWGLENLKFLEVDVLDNEDCRQRLKPTEVACHPIDCDKLVHPITICTLSPYGKTYSGDSGGPLVADGKLVGVVAWGILRTPGFPDAHMKVSEYSEWIKKTMQQF